MLRIFQYVIIDDSFLILDRLTLHTRYVLKRAASHLRSASTGSSFRHLQNLLFAKALAQNTLCIMHYIKVESYLFHIFSWSSSILFVFSPWLARVGPSVRNLSYKSS